MLNMLARVADCKNQMKQPIVNNSFLNYRFVMPFPELTFKRVLTLAGPPQSDGLVGRPSQHVTALGQDGHRPHRRLMT